MALAVEEASTVCNGAGLSSGSLAEAFALVVLAAVVGTIFMSLCFVVLLQDRVLWLKFSAGIEKLEFLMHEEKPHAEF